MRRSLKSYVDQAAKQEREMQALVWPRGAPAPRRSAAQGLAKALYPNHGSAVRQFEIVRREPAPNTAVALYPNLKER